MPKIRCRHCRKPIMAPDDPDWSGLVKCPACSRSTQYPAPDKETDLPPPLSVTREERDEANESSGGGCTLAIAVVCVLAGLGFVADAVSTASELRGIRQAIIAVFFVLLGVVFQTAA